MMVQLDQVEPVNRRATAESLGNRIAEDLKARGALDLINPLVSARSERLNTTKTLSLTLSYRLV